MLTTYQKIRRREARMFADCILELIGQSERFVRSYGLENNPYTEKIYKYARDCARQAFYAHPELRA